MPSFMKARQDAAQSLRPLPPEQRIGGARWWGIEPARWPGDLLLAVLLAAAAVVFRVFLDPIIEGVQPYVTVFLMVMVAALLRGVAAGVICFVLAAGVVLFMFHPQRMGWAWPVPVELLRLIPAAAVSLVGIAVAAAHRRWRLTAEVAMNTAREALSREAQVRAEHEAVIASALDPVVTMDARGIIRSSCRAVERVFGWKPEELVGQNISMLMPEPHRHQHDEYLARYRSTGRTHILGHTRQFEAVRRSGEIFPILLSVERVEIPGPRAQERRRTEDELFVGVMHDISELKAVEAELIEQQTKMAVANVQLLCREDELTCANVELKRSNADLESYARIIAHDLKEPLRGIASSARFIVEEADETLGAGHQDRLETVQRLAERMEGLMNALLDHARLGQSALERLPCQTMRIVEDALDQLRDRIEREHVHVMVASLPAVRADATLLGQVFANLIANGIKYNTAAQKEIRIGWLRSDDGTAIFTVHDNGIGIDRRHHEDVFAMFRRLHSRDKYGGGSGAGLAIVRKIINLHGGRMWLESDPSTEPGTMFLFTLGPESRLDDAPPPEVTIPGAAGPAHGASR
jgi:PAS domain S-box-containing protein